MPNTIYVVEGEIEQRFLGQLIHCDWVQPGVVRKFNLMQESMKSSNYILTKRYDKIFCIIDTNCADKSNCEKLSSNVRLLKSIGKVFVLVQHENFEDELQYMVNEPLGRFFGLRHHSTADVKKHLAQSVDYSSFITKGHLLRYGTRSGDFVKRFGSSGYKLGQNQLVDGSALLVKGWR